MRRYEVRVAERPEDLDGDPSLLLWRVEAPRDSPPFVVYGGPELRSRQRCYWRVLALGDDGVADLSPIACWTMGLLSANDWHAHWIGTRKRDDDTSVPYLIRPFEVDAERIDRATVYVTALGLYKLYINGEPVSDDRLTPGWTDYRRRIPVQAVEVTNLVKPGPNVIGLMLAEGWYCGLLGWEQYGRREVFGDAPPRALVQLEAVDGRGETHRVVSDSRWTYRPGPIQSASLYRGETWDLSRAVPGWNKVGRRQRGWQPVHTFPPPLGRLVGQLEPAIRVTERLRPVSVSEPRPGTFVVDFGQNVAGVCELRVNAAAGAEVVVRHGELLGEDGLVDARNLRRAESVDRYVLAGGESVLSPLFTYHGFRFAQVEGVPEALKAGDIEALVLHNDCPATAEFACADTLLERVHRMVLWTQRGNMHGILTDCPQRDERFGWFGDAGAFAPAACQNFNLGALLTKFNRDLHDSRNDDGSLPDFAPYVPLGDDIVPRRGTPGYMDAVVLFPWSLYWEYGDERSLRESFEAMRSYLRFAEDQCDDGLWTGYRGNDYADWIALEKSDRLLVATLLLVRCARLTGRSAEALGEQAAADEAHLLADRAADAVLERYCPRGRFTSPTQAILAMALEYGAIPDNQRKTIGNHLADLVAGNGDRLNTGIHGTAALLPALSKNGHHATAVRLARQRQRPSWGYMLDQGATTLWERWLSDRISRGDMNSQNHPAFGSVNAWIHQHLVGIQALEPGYARVRLQPGVTADGSVPHASSTLHTIRGPIRLDWRLDGETLCVVFEIPPSTRAELRIAREAGLDLDACASTLFGLPGVGKVLRDEDELRVEVAPGAHEVRLPRDPDSSRLAHSDGVATDAGEIRVISRTSSRPGDDTKRLETLAD